MGQVDGNLTVQAGEALEAKRCVKLDATASGTAGKPVVVYADAGDDFIGVTQYSVESGENVAIRPKHMGGTFEIECVIATAIAIGTGLETLNDGKVGDGAGTDVFTSLSAPGADNEHIECVLIG